METDNGDELWFVWLTGTCRLRDFEKWGVSSGDGEVGNQNDLEGGRMQGHRWRQPKCPWGQNFDSKQLGNLGDFVFAGSCGLGEACLDCP